jgi:hypothetical protein
MSTNFLFTQAPNRKGNQSKHTPKSNTGVTAVTRPSGGVAYGAGHQGSASTGKAATTGRGQKVSVSRPKDDYCHNDGYRSSSFLK